MMRISPLLIAAGLATLALAGCGGEEKEATESSKDQPSPTTTTQEATGTDEEAAPGGDSEAGTTDPDTAEETASAEAGKQSGVEREQAARSGNAQAEAETGDSGVPAGKAAARSLGCTSCHQADAQLVGPPYRAVAERYDGDKATILKRMKAAVTEGAQGRWSEVTQGAPMPPQPQAADQQAKLAKVAAWIAEMAE